MRKASLYGLLVALAMLPGLLWADSPLTSTPFAEAYLDVAMVKYAKDKGVMDKKIAKFLMNENIEPDQKAAVVNALGWAYEGKKNGDLFLAFLNKKYKGGVSLENFSALTATEKMCLGYMLALDDYFNPKRGLPMLEAAKKEMSGSFTCNLLLALVKAQVVFDENFCHVWKVVNTVNIDESLVNDFRQDARKIVMDYITLYQQDC